MARPSAFESDYDALLASRRFEGLLSNRQWNLRDIITEIEELETETTHDRKTGEPARAALTSAICLPGCAGVVDREKTRTYGSRWMRMNCVPQLGGPEDARADVQVKQRVDWQPLSRPVNERGSFLQTGNEQNDVARPPHG